MSDVQDPLLRPWKEPPEVKWCTWIKHKYKHLVYFNRLVGQSYNGWVLNSLEWEEKDGFLRPYYEVTLVWVKPVNYLGREWFTPKGRSPPMGFFSRIWITWLWLWSREVGKEGEE
jgi:hypothetical protein